MKEEKMENRNKYALITGATSGIGYEIARLLAKDRYNLVLVARGDEPLQNITDELKQEFSVEVTPLTHDLFDPDAPFAIYEAVKQMGITIDILVNDAGQGEWGEFIKTDLERQLDLIQLNVSSLVALTHLFLREMIARNEGKILQLGSEVSKSPMPLMAVYAATKAFVLSFSEALIDELKDTEISVTVLMPGATDTDFFHKARAENTKTYHPDKLLSPGDVAKDGYEAMMKGKDRVVAGTKTKMHVAMSTVMSDKASAKNLRKSMEPDKKVSRGVKKPIHAASAKERKAITKTTGKRRGDY
jgi:short-subunit dehydrogenase